MKIFELNHESENRFKELFLKINKFENNKENVFLFINGYISSSKFKKVNKKHFFEQIKGYIENFKTEVIAFKINESDIFISGVHITREHNCYLIKVNKTSFKVKNLKNGQRIENCLFYNKKKAIEMLNEIFSEFFLIIKDNNFDDIYENEYFNQYAENVKFIRKDYKKLPELEILGD